jgi:hypothetical protein
LNNEKKNKIKLTGNLDGKHSVIVHQCNMFGKTELFRFGRIKLGYPLIMDNFIPINVCNVNKSVRKFKNA